MELVVISILYCEYLAAGSNCLGNLEIYVILPVKLCWLSSLSNTLSFSCNCAISDSETTDLIIALELKICRISSLSLVGKFWFIWMLPSKGAYITVRNVDCNDSISD